MTSRPKAVIFDLGGVLLKWNPQVVNVIPSSQLRTIMNSVTWHDLDRGKITLNAACEISVTYSYRYPLFLIANWYPTSTLARL